MIGNRAISADEVARQLKGELCGAAGRVVRGVAPLGEAGPDDLSWIGDAKYASQLSATRAAVVLTPLETEAPAGQTIIRVPDPDLALCDVLRMLAPPAHSLEPGVHPDARVSSDARVSGAAIGCYCTVARGALVGPGTQLHAGVFVGEHTEIGRDCVLWPGVVVRERVRIGDRVVIHPNTTIGADGFGYLLRAGRHVKIPQIGTVVIEDDVEIGANCCVDRARSGVTRIRASVKIDNLVQIGHNCDIGEHSIIVSQTGVSGSCTLGRYVVLAGKAGVSDHVVLGDGVQAAARSGVTKSFPAGMRIRGNPAVELQAFMRQAAAARRLPKMIEQLRELTKRVKQLESADDNSK